jgi:hypothetical protein
VRRSIVLLFAVALALAGFTQAQVSSGNIFFGYSYGSINLNHGRNIGMNGFEGSVEGKVVPFLGLVASISGHYGDQSNFPTSTSSVSVAGSEYNFLFGPRVSFSVKRVRPFAHALFGGSHISVSGREVHYSASDVSFAYALGGGLDYRLWHVVGWRFQGDFLQTRFFGNTQNDGRFSTGLVLHF